MMVVLAALGQYAQNRRSEGVKFSVRGSVALAETADRLYDCIASHVEPDYTPSRTRGAREDFHADG